MSTSSEIIQRLRSLSEAQLREIERATEIPFPTLAKVRYGVTKDPRASLIDKVREFFEQQDAQAV